MHGFKAKLQRAGGVGTWVTVKVPAALSRALGTRARVPVKATVGGAPLVGSLAPDGHGGHFLVVNAQVRAAAGVEVGQVVEVRFERDEGPRVVEAPPELARGLAADRAAAKAWGAMSPSHQREYAAWVAGAKKAETRAARAEKAVGMIRVKARLK